MTSPITCDTQELNQAGTVVTTIAGDVSGYLSALLNTLDGCAGMCGNDPGGLLVARQVDSTTESLIKALTAVVNASRRAGEAVQASAANHGNADHHSNISAGKGPPLPFPNCTPPIPIRTPASTVGGVGEPFFARVVESLVGTICPNGKSEALHAATSAWRAMSGTCFGASASLKAPIAVVEKQRLSESQAMEAALEAIGTSFDGAAAACTNLATKLELYAAQLDEVHHALFNTLSRLGNPASLVQGLVHLVTGDKHDAVARDLRTILTSFRSEATGLAGLVGEYAHDAERVAATATRYAAIQLRDASAGMVDVAKAYAAYVADDPMRAGSDIATTAAGAAMIVGGVGGEGIGLALDATGVGAVPGVALGIGSAGVIAGGAGLIGIGAGDTINQTQGHMTSPMSKGGGGGRGPTYHKAPDDLKAFPKAQIAKTRKTPIRGGGGLRKRWIDDKGKIYEWDSQHGTVEVYNKNGRHLGEFHHETGEQLKPADPTRRVEK